MRGLPHRREIRTPLPARSDKISDHPPASSALPRVHRTLNTQVAPSPLEDVTRK